MIGRILTQAGDISIKSGEIVILGDVKSGGRDPYRVRDGLAEIRLDRIDEDEVGGVEIEDNRCWRVDREEEPAASLQ